MKIKKLENCNYDNYIIEVPKGIRYLSEWDEFKIFDYPHILDKKIPGCGFTELCLTNEQDLVLCSPRKMLLENKYNQHKDDIYYVINSYEKIVGVDKEINKITKLHYRIGSFQLDEDNKDPEVTKEERLKFYNNLKQSIESYIIERSKLGKPFKIIVTYDSFYLVKGILRELDITKQKYMFNKIQYVVDEMQSIFVDATFKSSTENEFMVALKDLQKICYVSATPMIERYLRSIEDFENLPYYELDWVSDDPSRIKIPNLIIRKLSSINSDSKVIIEKYLSGNFEYKYIKTKDGELKRIESREAVFFMNSVNNIFNVIKNTGLKPDQVNILCADTPDNNKRLKRKLGKKFSIGSIPLKGSPHKMFTFCTRTVYLGADFYSDNARTFVLSDANLDTLVVDISLDLPQILGRQRLEENPWKDEAVFFYKTICEGKKLTEAFFKNYIDKKSKVTQALLDIFSKGNDEEKLALVDKYESGINSEHYKKDYVAVNKIKSGPDKSFKYPILNKLVIISEMRAFDIQQIDYADRFMVFSRVGESFNINNADKTDIIRFFDGYEQQPNLYYKLKYLCEYPTSYDTKLIILDQIKEKHFKEYFLALGPEKLRSLSYNTGRISEYLGIQTFDIKNLEKDIYSEFEVGKRYTKTYIKERLSEIFKRNDYKKGPVASFIKNFFNIKTAKITLSDNTRVESFEIISKKK